MSLQSKLQPIGEMYAAILTPSYHYWRFVNTAPYLIWAEDGEADAVQTNNHKGEQAISGTTDYFTKDEFDANVDLIQDAMNELDGMFWALNSVQHEDETGLIHYEWRWEVI